MGKKIEFGYIYNMSSRGGGWILLVYVLEGGWLDFFAHMKGDVIFLESPTKISWLPSPACIK